ncbi:MAG: nuclear pore complex subunit [Flavobacteriales bacterium]|nr:nuclear pore complex subunit [Flavobacteriales bacterium]|tara:strand:- start:17300 stop:17680 length:381 start_codon:yes stop_codon:yes gene_type:complete
MEKLTIEGTPKTPTIKFDPETGKLLIQGRSIPENSIEFYKPLVDLLDEYNDTPKESTKVDIVLEYFNTSSSKCILDVFKKLEKIKSNGSEVIINWHYEEDDEDMLEAGEDYQAIINIPFKMIEIEE